MASKLKAIRKTVIFDDEHIDQALFNAVEKELSQKRYDSFSELCKIALHQFLLSQEPTQSVILFIALEKQIAELQSKFIQLEQDISRQTLAQLEILTVPISQIEERIQQLESDRIQSATTEAAEPEAARSVDPLLNRLGPLLEAF